MRVIGGEFRSRLLTAPPGSGTRPTSDRLRETLFNVLSSRIGGARFADLYAGSGAVGIEALSRGAHSCLFVERAVPAVAALRKNLQSLSIVQGVQLEARPVSKVLEALRAGNMLFDVVFLDPPYEAAAEYLGTLTALGGAAQGLLNPDALVVAEHAKRTPLPERIAALRRTRLLEQGDAALSFYALQSAPAHESS